MSQWAIIISKTVFVEDSSAELALIAGRKKVDAGEGLVSVTVEQMGE